MQKLLRPLKTHDEKRFIIVDWQIVGILCNYIGALFSFCIDTMY